MRDLQHSMGLHFSRVAVSISVAVAAHIYIERPLLEYSKQRDFWSFMKIALFKKAQQIPAISDADA
jgi:hypothetical protein